MKASADRPASPRPLRIRVLLLIALAVGPQAGCTREFFREWANQDVSEAVFEKSRDPRWRLDLFSWDPPALSRYADPYDRDVPPAPPDDYAAQAMSPVPQWPDNRLLMPLEGTGYNDMLESWGRYDSTPRPKIMASGMLPESAVTGAPGAVPPAAVPVPPTPPSGTSAPFAPRRNSGPGAAPTSPSSVPGPPLPNPSRPESAPPQARAPVHDLGVRLAAFQETGLPLPVPPPLPAPAAPARRRRDLVTPPIGGDPDPVNSDLSAPVNPRPDLTPEEYRASEAMGSEMAGILVPGAIDFDEAEAAGLPRFSRPYVLSLENSFTLALINARAYQFQLEQIYLASLAVTLQRFAFQPQFYAGLSPLTGVAQKGAAGGLSGGTFPIASPANSFLYRTRETGNPASALNIGTVAGVGKVFSSGGQLLLGFANQIVFNFLGKNSRQPTVQSSLPLTFIQPFLRGGGRAVTLENLTQAERNLLYTIRSFAKFRQEFVVATLVGGSFQTFGSNIQNQGFSVGGGPTDPVVGYLNVLQDIQEIENDKKNIAAFEQLARVYKELIEGESSGLSQLQLDQVESSVQQARQALVQDRFNYRGAIDQFKIQLGMPPDVPIVLDRTLTRRFKQVFDGIDVWQRDPRRNLEDLPDYAKQLPDLEDVIIDGRSVLGVYNKMTDNEDELEDVLLASERVALEHRLDLMNQRAQLYDAWRQIRVSANALKGVLNVSLTNQILTPPTTSNPFAFVDQAKQFSLVLNAELPLVRMAERNAFVGSLINYQRQRRTLQNAEDFLKFQLRNDVRNLQFQYLNYEISRRNFVLTIRQKDQAFEQIIAPPQQAGAGGGTAQASLAATQTTNLINFQSRLLALENSLVQFWLSYELARLTLYRDLGTLPYDEWEAYHALFPPESFGAGGGAAAGSVAGAPRPAPSSPPQPPGR